LDTDSVKKREEVIRILDEFGKGKVRILVGTKMVIKGLDFRNVGFVGVLNADSFLSRPADFRAEEKTYQTLRQVVGRIRTGGVAVIQTRMPGHRIIRAVMTGDTEGIYRKLYESRRLLDLPPFRKMAILEVRSEDRELWKENERVLENFVLSYDGGATIWGPYYPSMVKVRGRYRVRITVLAAKPTDIGEVAARISQLPLKGQVLWDVDPYDVD
jgi:primosomal protein N' (replication factor Y)